MQAFVLRRRNHHLPARRVLTQHRSGRQQIIIGSDGDKALPAACFAQNDGVGTAVAVVVHGIRDNDASTGVLSGN